MSTTVTYGDTLYIDGVSARTVYGVSLAEGSLAQVVALPAVRMPAVNDWRDGGTEVDTAEALSEDVRRVQVRLIAHRSDLSDFFSALADGGTSVHTWQFRQLSTGSGTYVERPLRLVAMPQVSRHDALTILSLTLEDDTPLLQGYTYAAPTASGLPVQGLSIDSHDVSWYHCQLLAGTRDAMYKAPDTKQNLTVSLPSGGALYDAAGGLMFGRKTARVQLLMRHGTTATFWRCWRALLYNITRNGLRTLTYAPESLTVHGIYTGAAMSVFHLTPFGGCMCRFSLDFLITDQNPAQ